MDIREIVIRAARNLSLLDHSERLVPLDSLSIIDLILEIEEQLGKNIPITALTINTASSIESLTELVRSTVATS